MFTTISKLNPALPPPILKYWCDCFLTNIITFLFCGLDKVNNNFPRNLYFSNTIITSFNYWNVLHIVDLIDMYREIYVLFLNFRAKMKGFTPWPAMVSALIKHTDYKISKFYFDCTFACHTMWLIFHRFIYVTLYVAYVPNTYSSICLYCHLCYVC